MKRNGNKILVTAAGCLILAISGCMIAGRDFPVEHVSQIQTGKTTQMDIQRMFGPPWRTGIENGKTTWTYGKYRISVSGTTQTSDLVIRFDQNNVVEAWTYNTN